MFSTGTTIYFIQCFLFFADCPPKCAPLSHTEIHLYLIPFVSQVVDIDSSQLLRGIGSDELPAQVGPHNVALDDDKSSGTQHSTDFFSKFRDLFTF